MLWVAGQRRLLESAGAGHAALAVVAALCSSLHDRAVPPDSVFLGEVGLGDDGSQRHRAGGMEDRLRRDLRGGFPRQRLREADETRTQPRAAAIRRHAQPEIRRLEARVLVRVRADQRGNEARALAVEEIDRCIDDLGFGFGWWAVYVTVFLSWWNGQTVGKRLQENRVVVVVRAFQFLGIIRLHDA